MAGLLELKERLKNLQVIEHIIRSMRVMAAIRWRRARRKLQVARSYDAEVERLLGMMVSCPSPLVYCPVGAFRLVGAIRNTGLIVITSDQGLCGAFNFSLLDAATHFIEEEKRRGRDVKIIALGRYGERYFRKSPLEILYARSLPLSHALSFLETMEISRRVEDFYQDGVFDQLFVIYNAFISFGHYRAVTKRLLPPQISFRPRPLSEDYLISGDVTELQQYLLAEHLAVRIYLALVESMVSEQGARLQTMEAALNNVEEIINQLTQEYHILRQESITREVLEIMTGAGFLAT